ncbi:hypothetical protein BN903_26 [Halorubrum sp. AJ67]|nr:hypothetical protein BN903_26 [Halorubrum sp. AJ67]
MSRSERVEGAAAKRLPASTAGGFGGRVRGNDYVVVGG